MPRMRNEVPNLEDKVKNGQKKFVRYEEGAMIYSLGLNTFKQLARDAGAVYRVKRCVLVNVCKIDEYLEAFREDMCFAKNVGIGQN